MSWVIEAKHNVAIARELIQNLSSELNKTDLNIEKISDLIDNLLIQQDKLNNYIEPLSQYIEKQALRRKLEKKTSLHAQNLGGTLQALQSYKDKITTLLQTYPYTSPYAVRDEFWPIITTYASDVQSIDISHIDSNQALAIKQLELQNQETISENQSDITSLSEQQTTATTVATTTATTTQIPSSEISNDTQDDKQQLIIPKTSLDNILTIAKNQKQYRSKDSIWWSPPANAWLSMHVEQMVHCSRTQQPQ